MNTMIWTAQVVLAIILTLSGFLILIFKGKLKHRLTWLHEYSPEMVIFICLTKIVGALGLVLPMCIGIMPILTPFSALGIALFMACAFYYHIDRKEYKDIPATVVFFMLALLIAYHRI